MDTSALKLYQLQGVNPLPAKVVLTNNDRAVIGFRNSITEGFREVSFQMPRSLKSTGYEGRPKNFSSDFFERFGMAHAKYLNQLRAHLLVHIMCQEIKSGLASDLKTLVNQAGYLNGTNQNVAIAAVFGETTGRLRDALKGDPAFRDEVAFETAVLDTPPAIFEIPEAYS